MASSLFSFRRLLPRRASHPGQAKTATLTSCKQPRLIPATLILLCIISLHTISQWNNHVADVTSVKTPAPGRALTNIDCSFNSPSAPQASGYNELYGSYLADVTEPLTLADTPLFWHVPKSGGTTMKDIGRCSGLVEASNSGTAFEFDIYGNPLLRDRLIVFEPANGWRLVNVDSDTPAGLERAKAMGLVPSGLADVIYSSRIFEATAIFDPDHRGRMFTLLRHPIERAVSIFYYLQGADWEPTFLPETKGWSIEEYANSTFCENNWITRMIVNNMETELSEFDLDFAKGILREKVLVGLTSNMKESVKRFDSYFGFEDGSGRFSNCTIKLAGGSKGSNRNTYPKLEPDSVAWQLLAQMNYWDIQLYEYALELFEEQAFLTTGLKIYSST